MRYSISTRKVRTPLLLGALLGFLQSSVAGVTLSVAEVRPSDADPRIQRFDEPNLVIFDPDLQKPSDLVVFLPGTDGVPRRAERLLTVVAEHGFHVIALEYNDSPAVIQVCPQDIRASCSAEFRQARVFGDVEASAFSNRSEESIVARLTSLLAYLASHNSEGRWEYYLTGNAPDWRHIIVSGFSQGAGMAAYIAKREPVSRVVLLSGPWDYRRDPDNLAPWLSGASVTASERWFAAFHRRENTAAYIARAYAALGIAKSHIRIFDHNLPTDSRARLNPYHSSVIRNTAYESDWVFLFGRPY